MKIPFHLEGANVLIIYGESLITTVSLMAVVRRRRRDKKKKRKKQSEP